MREIGKKKRVQKPQYIINTEAAELSEAERIEERPVLIGRFLKRESHNIPSEDYHGMLGRPVDDHSKIHRINTAIMMLTNEGLDMLEPGMVYQMEQDAEGTIKVLPIGPSSVDSYLLEREDLKEVLTSYDPCITQYEKQCSATGRVSCCEVEMRAAINADPKDFIDQNSSGIMRCGAIRQVLKCPSCGRIIRQTEYHNMRNAGSNESQGENIDIATGTFSTDAGTFEITVTRDMILKHQARDEYADKCIEALREKEERDEVTAADKKGADMKKEGARKK